MERHFEHRGTRFVWHEATARTERSQAWSRLRRGGYCLDDPLFVLQDASRNDEGRDAAIGFSSAGRPLTVVHIEVDGEHIRIISARRASASEEAFYDQ